MFNNFLFQGSSSTPADQVSHGAAIGGMGVTPHPFPSPAVYIPRVHCTCMYMYVCMYLRILILVCACTMSLPYCCKYYKCYIPVVCTCVFAVLTILSSDQKCHTYFHFELLSVQTSIFLNPYRELCACSICVMPYTRMYTCMYGMTHACTHACTCTL